MDKKVDITFVNGSAPPIDDINLNAIIESANHNYDSNIYSSLEINKLRMALELAKLNSVGYYDIFDTEDGVDLNNSNVTIDTTAQNVTFPANDLSNDLVGYLQGASDSVIDDDGVMHVIWHGTDVNNAQSQIKYSKSIDGGTTWYPWKNIKVVSGYPQTDPRIDVDNNGNIHVTWKGRDAIHTSEYQIRYMKSEDNGITWIGYQEITDMLGEYQFEPVVKVDSENNVHIVWRGQDSALPEYAIKYSRSSDGGDTWSSWINITDIPGYNQTTPDIAIDQNDIIHLVWSGAGPDYPDKNQVRYKNSDDGGDTWKYDVNVTEDLSFDHTDPYIYIDKFNILHLVWSGFDIDNQSNLQIKFSKSEDGGNTWSNWINVSEVTGYDQYEPEIYKRSDGSLHVVWHGTDVDNTGIYNQIKYSRSINGGSLWSAWENIGELNGYNNNTPNILIDESDNIHVTWIGDDSFAPDGQVKYIKSTDGGVTWSSYIKIMSHKADIDRILSILEKDFLINAEHVIVKLFTLDSNFSVIVNNKEALLVEDQAEYKIFEVEDINSKSISLKVLNKQNTILDDLLLSIS